MSNTTEDGGAPQALPEASLEGLCATLIKNDLDLKGGATWAPVREVGRDYSAWGSWEVWPECTVGVLPSGAVGAIHTGAFMAWEAHSGQQMCFRSQKEAEMFAVLQNGPAVDSVPAATRVVALDGAESRSRFDYEKVRAAVAAQGAPV
jgi:hypothetical protein